MRKITVAEMLEAIKKNGYPQETQAGYFNKGYNRFNHFNDDTEIIEFGAACAVAQGAVNLKVSTAVLSTILTQILINVDESILESMIANNMKPDLEFDSKVTLFDAITYLNDTVHLSPSEIVDTLLPFVGEGNLKIEALDVDTIKVQYKYIGEKS